MSLTLLEVITIFLNVDVGWFLIGLASSLWVYGIGRQIHTQEGYWEGLSNRK